MSIKFGSKLPFSVFTILCCIIARNTVHSRLHPSALDQGRAVKINTDFQADWVTLGQQALEQALQIKQNNNVAKNVIMFLGDGMGISTVTAGRIYAGQMRGQVGESYQLSFDKFPHVAHSKTYNVDYQVPDSAGTATAFLCGEKANLGVIGVNQHVIMGDCSTMPGNNITSILRWSIAEGKRTGVVTTTRITHATPAASYAHSADRDWEVDRDVPVADRDNPLCEDIAKQLITKNSDINVILGGGRSNFLPNTEQDYEYPDRNGSRGDGRNLIEEWKAEMTTLERSHAFVWNKTAFDNINPDSTDYILGLFDRSHMQYSLERESKDGAGEPTLAELTSLAIRSLSRSQNGYFLLVEGGRIDHGHHANWAKAALSDLAEFDDAVQTAVDLTNEADTLIVVTADHSHVFTVGGYPDRNNSILELVGYFGEDDLPFTSLMYANGPSGEYGRVNLTGTDTTADEFRQPAHVHLSSETHAGEDVSIFARGPMSHLFHGVQEQHYIAHAMAYASCVGINKKHCDTGIETTTTNKQDCENSINAAERSHVLSHFVILLFTIFSPFYNLV